MSSSVATAATEPPPPPGANVACTPTAAHPEPVILVHGTFANRSNNWQTMAPALKNAGYCVYALDYGAYNGSDNTGVYGVGRIEDSAAQLRDYVNQVLAQTGATKVDLVGHSQGGMMPRYYIKNLGGSSVVDDLVGISPSNHGTTTPLAAPSGGSCPSCSEQAAGSAFLTALNSGDESPGAVSYTQIVTRNDEVVTPYTSGYLAADTDVTNITIQDKCATDTSDHLAMAYDSPVISETLNALGRTGPADPAYQPPCGP